MLRMTGAMMTSATRKDRKWKVPEVVLQPAMKVTVL
jgi:hypothetical protein